MDNKTDIDDLAGLLAELDRLRSEVMATADAHPDQGALQMVARLVRGLDEARSAQLLTSAREQGWFALQLSPADYPRLHALCALSDALPGVTCPFTSALRPESFASHLREEAERACRHNADLALVVLSGAAPLDEHGLHILAQSALLEMGGGETLGRTDADHLAIIVPGARQIKARALAERILDHFAAALPINPAQPATGAAARAGIACFSPSDSADDPARLVALLREQAQTALKTAPPNQARVYQHDQRPVAERTVLVQAGEKHFLFFGSMEQS